MYEYIHNIQPATVLYYKFHRSWVINLLYTFFAVSFLCKKMAELWLVFIYFSSIAHTLCSGDCTRTSEVWKTSYSFILTCFLPSALCCTMYSTCCTVWLHGQTADRLGLQESVLLPSLCCTMYSTCCTVWLHWQTAGRLGLQDKSRLPHPSPSRQMPQVPLPPVWCPLEFAWQESVIKIYFQIFILYYVRTFTLVSYKFGFLYIQLNGLGPLELPFKLLVYLLFLYLKKYPLCLLLLY